MWVFGYGSLTVAAGGLRAVLPGHRRTWGVAMDNTVDLPGYKYWVDPATGARPAVVVAFLDLVEDASASTDGVCAPVADFTALDARERQYRRVPAPIDGLGDVFTYVGREQSRERLRRGRAEGRAVIAASYLRTVCAGLGVPESELDVEGLPVVELSRIDLP